MIIESYIDEKIFKDFSVFNILKRIRQWKAPITFASILSFCAVICFIMNKVDGSVLLGSVLLLVGLGVPAVYFITFFSSLNKQAKLQNLSTPKLVYTLELSESPDGIFIKNDKEKATYNWSNVYMAYKNKNCTYLFLTANKAFLLPHNCVKEGADVLWDLLNKMIDKEKCIIIK